MRVLMWHLDAVFDCWSERTAALLDKELGRRDDILGNDNEGVLVCLGGLVFIHHAKRLGRFSRLPMLQCAARAAKKPWICF